MGFDTHKRDIIEKNIEGHGNAKEQLVKFTKKVFHSSGVALILLMLFSCLVPGD
jgi:hypothetical protein